VVREILFFEAKGKGTRVAEALERVNRLLTRRSVVFLFSDFQDRFFVSCGILGTDVAIDLLAICVEINVGWPTIHPKTGSRFGVSLGIDPDGQQMLTDGLDQQRIFESFFLEHSTGRTVITVEVNQDRFAGRLGQFHGSGQVVGPSDLGILAGTDIC
jgi:hypothetical protein